MVLQLVTDTVKLVSVQTRAEFFVDSLPAREEGGFQSWYGIPQWGERSDIQTGIQRLCVHFYSLMGKLFKISASALLSINNIYCSR